MGCRAKGRGDGRGGEEEKERKERERRRAKRARECGEAWEEGRTAKRSWEGAKRLQILTNNTYLEM